MALFRRSKPAEPAPAPPVPPSGPGPSRKEGPTPTRREAEAARRQRVTPQLTKKQARQEASAHNRAERMKAISARESQPERVLMRDFVDSRFSIGEVLLPALVLILLSSFLPGTSGAAAKYSAFVMYGYITAVILDLIWMWRKFKRILAERLPRSSPKGLFMYGMNRTIQIRRLRMPPPRVKRRGSF